MNTRFTLALVALVFVTLSSSTAIALESVDPNVYLKTRLGKPNAMRELAAKPVELSVAILAHGPRDEMFAARSAYPAGAPIEELRALERRALVLAAIHVVAAKKPDGALRLLEGVVTGHRDAAVRAEAAEQLGELGDAALPLMMRAANDADASVREAAVVGMGRVRSGAGFDALASFARDGADARRQAAALRGLAVMSSRWAWHARGDVKGGEAMRARALLLVNGTGATGATGTGIERTEANGAAIDALRKALSR